MHSHFFLHVSDDILHCFRPTSSVSVCSAPIDHSPDTGAADCHRPVGGGVAVASIVAGQDQNRLPDGDGVEKVGVQLSGEEGGAEVAGALSLPDRGRDLVRIGGSPAEGAPQRTSPGHINIRAEIRDVNCAKASPYTFSLKK